MSHLFTRRRLLGAGAVTALTTAGVGARAASAEPAGQLITLRSPVRVFDSRSAPSWMNGGRLHGGNSVAVTVFAPPDGSPLISAFLNVTVTQTLGSGYLTIRGSDLSGEVPLPNTSNINWWTSGLTLANQVLTTIGGENAIEVHCGGAGSTFFIVDLFGYVPFLG